MSRSKGPVTAFGRQCQSIIPVQQASWQYELTSYRATYRPDKPLKGAIAVPFQIISQKQQNLVGLRITHALQNMLPRIFFAGTTGPEREWRPLMNRRKGGPRSSAASSGQRKAFPGRYIAQGFEQSPEESMRLNENFWTPGKNCGGHLVVFGGGQYEHKREREFLHILRRALNAW